MKKNKFISFLINRLDEKSTWRAIIAILTVAGVSLSPEQTETIVAAGVALGALFEAFTPDPNGKLVNSKSKDNKDNNNKEDVKDGVENNDGGDGDEENKNEKSVKKKKSVFDSVWMTHDD